MIPQLSLRAGTASWVHLSAGDLPSDQMWGYFQVELRGVEPREVEARRKIGELSEKHVVGQFNQG